MVTTAAASTLLLASLLTAGAAAGLTALPANSTWALLAWGFDAGGKDNVTAATKIVDVDLFDQADTIPALKAAGHTVLCYFSAGSWESWRPDANATAWDAIKIGQMDGWNELWLDVRKLAALQAVMGPRLDLAAAQLCDGVEPDNTDCVYNDECWSSMAAPVEPSGDVVVPAQVAYNTVGGDDDDDDDDGFNTSSHAV